MFFLLVWWLILVINKLLVREVFFTFFVVAVVVWLVFRLFFFRNWCNLIIFRRGFFSFKVVSLGIGRVSLLLLFPYKHTTCIPRWNEVETTVSRLFQRYSTWSVCRVITSQFLMFFFGVALGGVDGICFWFDFCYISLFGICW